MSLLPMSRASALGLFISVAGSAAAHAQIVNPADKQAAQKPQADATEVLPQRLRCPSRKLIDLETIDLSHRWGVTTRR